MNITGYDYIFYSPIKHKTFFKKFRKSIKAEIWSTHLETFEYDKENDNIMSHFQKDQEMNDFSQEYAYALNANGEGAFAIFTSKHQKHSVQSLSRDLFTTVDQVNFDCSDYEPCPTVYIYSKIFQYTSVLPAKIDESEFAKCVHQCAFKSLTK